MSGVPNWILPAAAFITALGFEVSGFESKPLAFILWSLATCLLFVPIWPWIKTKIQGHDAELEIVFDSKDYYYTEFGSPTGHGLDEGAWKHYRVKIRNNTNGAIEDLQVQVTDVMPRPNELLGRLPLFLKFKDYPRNVNKVNLAPGGEILVDVASYQDKFLNASLIIEEAGEETRSPIEIYSREDEDQGDPFYTITIRPVALNGVGHNKTFRLGVRNKDLFLEEMPRIADETFEILSGLYYEGLEIYNRGFDSSHEKVAWVASLDAWIVRVESLLKERASPSARHSFRATIIGAWRHVPNKNNDWEHEHREALSKYSNYLYQLDEIIRFGSL